MWEAHTISRYFSTVHTSELTFFVHVHVHAAGTSQPPPPYTPTSYQPVVQQPYSAPVGVYDQGARFNDKTRASIPVSCISVSHRNYGCVCVCAYYLCVFYSRGLNSDMMKSGLTVVAMEWGVREWGFLEKIHYYTILHRVL